MSYKRKIHTLLPPIFFGIFVLNGDELCCVNLARVNAKNRETAKKAQKHKNPFVPSVPFCGGLLPFDTKEKSWWHYFGLGRVFLYEKQRAIFYCRNRVSSESRFI